MTDATQLWTTCAAIIRSQVSDVVWQTTFNHVEPVAVTEHELVLAVPNALAKERVDHRYRGLVHDALAELGQAMLDVRVEVRTAPAPIEPTQQQLQLGTTPPPAPVVSESRPPDPPKAAPTAESVNSRYTFDDFVTGTSNRFAHAAALAVAETPARSYNPLFIYGDAGLGKTHLLQAIANYVHDHYPTYKVRYVSTETFLNRFVDAIRNNTLPEFKRRYREIDVLLVDDIQFMEGKEGLQEEFFHTFNSLHQANRQIVLSSDRPPDSIPTLEDRLRSRFKMGLITDIQPPDLETRLAILRKKGDNESIPIPPEVLEFIASNVTDNIRELEGALIRVSAYASLNHLPCTVELAERVLGDVVARRAPRPVTPTLILEHTARMYGLSIDEITGSSRRRPLVNARQIAMYVIRELTDLSYPAIAREFGGRDHTTVIHAVEKIRNLMGERRQIYEQVTTLIDEIRGGDD